MLRFDAYGFQHLLVFNHPFHTTCMKDMASFHTYVMTNLKHDLFLCHVLAAHSGQCVVHTHQERKYTMVLVGTFVMKNLFYSLRFCPLLQRLSAVFLPKTFG